MTSKNKPPKKKTAKKATQQNVSKKAEVSEHRRRRRKRRLRYEAGVGERRGADDASKVADDEGGGLARKSKVLRTWGSPRGSNLSPLWAHQALWLTNSNGTTGPKAGVYRAV